LSPGGGVAAPERTITLALSELGWEVEILGANVQASELLRGFCGREGCEMFAGSEQSYSRALLYLKDQIKDLKVSDRDLTDSDIRPSFVRVSESTECA
jgi:hypothetical protein